MPRTIVYWCIASQTSFTFASSLAKGIRSRCTCWTSTECCLRSARAMHAVCPQQGGRRSGACPLCPCPCPCSIDESTRVRPKPMPVHSTTADGGLEDTVIPKLPQTPPLPPTSLRSLLPPTPPRRLCVTCTPSSSPLPPPVSSSPSSILMESSGRASAPPLPLQGISRTFLVPICCENSDDEGEVGDIAAP